MQVTKVCTGYVIIYVMPLYYKGKSKLYSMIILLLLHIASLYNGEDQATTKQHI